MLLKYHSSSASREHTKLQMSAVRIYSCDELQHIFLRRKQHGMSFIACVKRCTDWEHSTLLSHILLSFQIQSFLFISANKHNTDRTVRRQYSDETHCKWFLPTPNGDCSLSPFITSTSSTYYNRAPFAVMTCCRHDAEAATSFWQCSWGTLAYCSYGTNVFVLKLLSAKSCQRFSIRFKSATLESSRTTVPWRPWDTPGLFLLWEGSVIQTLPRTVNQFFSASHTAGF